MTTLFAMCLELIVNLFLDIKYDLFGYFTKGVDRKALCYLFGIYPAINITFINFFSKQVPHPVPLYCRMDDRGDGF